MSTVFITGVAGFLGSRLARRFLKEGHQVKGIDIISRSDAWRLRDLDIDYLWMSLQDLRRVDADYVVHTAAIADVPFALASPLFTLQQNVMGTIALMESCRNSTIRRIILMSSESVYGYAKTIPIPEIAPMNPSNIYGASKASQELIASSYYYSYNMPITIIRSSTLYGPYMRKSQVVPIFLQKAIRNEPITIHGDGQQTRDLNYIDNLITGILLVMGNSEALGETYNIASGYEISIIDLANLCIKISGSKSPVHHLPQRPGEQGIRLVLDISKAKQLGYKPDTTLDEGLYSVANWLRKE